LDKIRLYDPTKPDNSDWVGHVEVFHCHNVDKIPLDDECEVMNLVSPKN